MIEKSMTVPSSLSYILHWAATGEPALRPLRYRDFDQRSLIVQMQH
ncbi:hypothetical protein [Bradyrhizobium sp. RDM4]